MINILSCIFNHIRFYFCVGVNIYLAHMIGLVIYFIIKYILKMI
jgi:hypothetical protein